jgi:cysteine synthase
MRTPLIFALSLALHTAAMAQPTMLANRTEPTSTTTSTAVAMPPAGTSTEARATISQVMEAELQAPALRKAGARLVFVDVKGALATARVDYDRTHPTKVYYYHLRQTEGQWHVIERNTYSQLQP